MAINHYHQFIYTHITKTGGSSLYKMFNMNVPLISKHYTAYENQRMYKRYWRKYYKFAFMRNPYDRFLSAHAYHIKMFDKNINRSIPARSLCGKYRNVNEFIHIVKNNPNKLEIVLSDLHFKHQYKWLNAPLDFIGTLENYENDLLFIFNKLHLKPSPKILQTNVTSHGDITILNPQSLNFIERTYQKDFELYNKYK